LMIMRRKWHEMLKHLESKTISHLKNEMNEIKIDDLESISLIISARRVLLSKNIIWCLDKSIRKNRSIYHWIYASKRFEFQTDSNNSISIFDSKPNSFNCQEIKSLNFDSISNSFDLKPTRFEKKRVQKVLDLLFEMCS
jgi:hypothetical protein